MKKCPSCAEQVQDEAFVCRYCSHKFNKKPNILARWAVVLAGIIAVGMCTMAIDPDAASSDPNNITTIDTAKRTECTKTLTDQVGKGFIMKMPSDTRLDVDEIGWSFAMADDKRVVLAVLACHAFGKNPDDLNFGEHVVVYGARTGKRLAMLSSAGVKFE